MYEIKKVITICPHCYNVLKNEYPDLGADFGLLAIWIFISTNKTR
jgi:Fe-S oxidoreductase